MKLKTKIWFGTLMVFLALAAMWIGCWTFNMAQTGRLPEWMQFPILITTVVVAAGAFIGFAVGVGDAV